MKNHDVGIGWFSNKSVMTLLKTSMPAAAPITKGSQNFHAAEIFLILGVIISIKRSYTLSTTAIVPTETPGITVVIPNTSPMPAVLKIFMVQPV